MMTRMHDGGANRWLSCCLAGILLLPAISALAQRPDERAANERGPRFLLSETNGATPFRILDPSRVSVLRRRLTLNLDGVPLKEALDAVAAGASLALDYRDDVLPAGRSVRLKVDGLSVAAALTEILLDARI